MHDAKSLSLTMSNTYKIFKKHIFFITTLYFTIINRTTRSEKMMENNNQIHLVNVCWNLETKYQVVCPNEYI